ncbi:cation diffusion facilitator family transporter [Geomicrobium sp. JSM 1781026]
MGKTITSKLLFLSVFTAFIFAIVGIIWGLLSSSQMILFDGVYSVISLIMSLIALLGSMYVDKEDSGRFPFGKATIEPAIVIVQGVVISILCVAAISSSITSMMSGGREVALGSALGYGIFSLVICFAIQYVMKKNRHHSEFIKAEAAQWLMDTLLSVAVVVGFIGALLLQSTSVAWIIPYIDPFMVLLAGLYFLSVPITLIKRNGRELLRMTPDSETQTRLESHVQKLKKNYHIEGASVRSSKVGRTMYIDIDFLLDRTSTVRTVEDMDQVREKLDLAFHDMSQKRWVNVSFTRKKKWARECS